MIPPGMTIRCLNTLEEYEACVELQEIVWGKGFAERVPVSILIVAQKLDGLVAGAFTETDILVGFVFGLTGRMEGQIVHWSDMLAVHPDWRGRGIGQALKWFQHDTLLERGIRSVYWTYEPLEARNAYLNLQRLGAEVEAYVPDFYPEHTGSPLHEGLGMDRFIVRWDLGSARVREARRRGGLPCPDEARKAPLLDLEHVDLDRTNPFLRIAIPRDIQALKAQAPAEARRWREVTRRLFLHYLPHYHVVAFCPAPRASVGYYVLAREI